MTDKEINDLVENIRGRIAEANRELIFDPEPHSYHFRGNALKSVSEVCEQFAQAFDARGNAERVAQKTGKSVDEILAQWRANAARACVAGTRTHAYAEWKFYTETQRDVPADLEFFESKKPVPNKAAVDAVWNFLKNDFSAAKYVPVAAENRVMNLPLGYAGTFDLLALEILKNGEIGLVIFDYKTNENLFDIFRDNTMLTPIEDFHACCAAHYTCQLALYQLALEKIVPEIPISRRVLFWLDTQGVNLIEENSRERFENAGKKWKFLPMETIDALKKNYRFRSREHFGTLALPDISQKLHQFLSEQ